MNSKVLLSFLLTAILSLALVSAVDLISIAKGPVLSESNNQTYFDIRANKDILLTMTNPILQINDGKNHYMTVTLTPSSVTDKPLPLNSVERITANIAVDSGFIFDIKTYTFPEINLTAKDSTNSTLIDAKKLSLEFLKTFCKYGEKGSDLSLTNVDVNNQDGDDTEWMPLDEISIEVEVSNDGIDKVREVSVELGLYDSAGKNIVKDLRDLNTKKAKLGTINDGDDKITTFTFKVPIEFKDENYKLVVKAYSEDKKEENLCVSQSSYLGNTYYESISGLREDTEEKQIVVDNIKITPSPAACSDKVQISAEAVNVGDTDYEDQIRVTLYNKDLGINLEQVIRKNFDQGDSSPVDFEFSVPDSAAEKTYSLEFKTYYDYDTSDESYAIESEKITQSLTVQGNCQKTVAENTNARITAELDSETPEAIAGKQVIVKANLKNTGLTETTYTTSVYGNTAWSTFNSITPQTITLAPGDSKDMSIVLTLDAEAQGDQEFTIKTSYGSKTTEQKVALTITKSQVTGTAITEHLKANWFIYLIVLINIILIIAIISVIRRMLSPRREEYQ
jgi:hypothetical protein